MFDPMRARLASSFSRNGISEAAIDAIWLGATSIISTFSRSTSGKSDSSLDFTLGFANEPSSFRGALACPMILNSSSSALR